MMDRFTQVSLRMISLMAKARNIFWMEVVMWDLSWMASFMVAVNINSLSCNRSMMECGTRMKLRARV